MHGLVLKACYGKILQAPFCNLHRSSHWSQGEWDYLVCQDSSQEQVEISDLGCWDMRHFSKTNQEHSNIQEVEETGTLAEQHNCTHPGLSSNTFYHWLLGKTQPLSSEPPLILAVKSVPTPSTEDESIHLTLANSPVEHLPYHVSFRGGSCLRNMGLLSSMAAYEPKLLSSRMPGNWDRVAEQGEAGTASLVCTGATFVTLGRVLEWLRPILLSYSIQWKKLLPCSCPWTWPQRWSVAFMLHPCLQSL